MTNFNLLRKRGRIAGVAAVAAIAALIYGPKLYLRLSSEMVESNCMRLLEETAKAAQQKGPEEHAQAIFHTMATPDCKAYEAHSRY